MRAALILLLAPICLSGCEAETTVEAGSPEAPPPAAPSLSMAGVDLTGDLRLIGTEPFWDLDLLGDRMVYSGVDRPEQAAPRPEPVVAGTTATWTGAMEDGTPLVVMVMDTPCSDGMSDRTYPLTARVEVGEETLNGCAATPRAIATSGESGPVVETPPAEG